MEELLAEYFLWNTGLKTQHDYENLLHSLFLENPQNEFLMELEYNTNNYKNTAGHISTYLENNSSDLDLDVLGRKIVTELHKIYDLSIFNLHEFGKLCCELRWTIVNNFDELGFEKPFFLMSIADEINDNNKKEFYSEIFHYYDN